MKYRTIFYLVLTTLCLATLLLLMEQRLAEESAARASFINLRPEYNPALIVRLRIESNGWEIDIERSEREWRIVNPFQERADSEKVNRILAHIARMPIRETMTREQWHERGLSLHHFGLDEPRSILTLSDGERKFVFSLGIQSPLDDGLYIRPSGTPFIVLTDHTLAELLPNTADGLRKQTIVEGIPLEIKRLDIKPYAAPYRQLVRDPVNDQWKLKQPIEAHTGKGVVEEMLYHLFDAKIKYFLPETASTLPSAYELENGEAQVQVTIWNNDTDNGTELFFGKPVTGNEALVYARRGDSSSVFAVPRHVRDVFLATPNDLRDKRVFTLAPLEVGGIKIRDKNDETVELRLKDTGWHVMQPVQWKADNETAVQMVFRLSALRTKKYITDPPVKRAELGLDPPDYELALWPLQHAQANTDKTNSAPPAQRILIGKLTADKGEYYACTDHDTAVFTVPFALLDGHLIGTNSAGMSFTNPLVYHDRSVISADPASLWRIELQHSDKHQIIERNDDGLWHVVKPENHRLNKDYLQTLLDTVSHLRALRVEHRGIEEPSVFGFDRPGLKLTLHFTGSDAISKTLITGFRARTDAVFAMIQGRDLAFAISRDRIELLSRNLTLPYADHDQP